MTNKEKNDQKRLLKSEQELISDLKKQESRQTWNNGKLTVYNVIWVMFLHLAITEGFNWFYLIMLVLLLPWWWVVNNWVQKQMISIKYRKELKAVRDEVKRGESNQ